MTFKEYLSCIKCDIYRITGNKRNKALVQHIIAGESFKYIFWMRTCNFLYKSYLFRYSFFPLAYLILNHYKYRLGISISFRTQIGIGFYIGHFGGIVVHTDAVIGKNCNISQGVTIGVANRGDRKGCPKIGDNVYIGPGAKIIGRISIGNFAAIGANAVVTKDVPENGVAVGIPAKIISLDGSAGYVNRTL